MALGRASTNGFRYSYWYGGQFFKDAEAGRAGGTLGKIEGSQAPWCPTCLSPEDRLCPFSTRDENPGGPWPPAKRPIVLEDRAPSPTPEEQPLPLSKSACCGGCWKTVTRQVGSQTQSCFISFFVKSTSFKWAYWLVFIRNFNLFFDCDDSYDAGTPLTLIQK